MRSLRTVGSILWVVLGVLALFLTASFAVHGCAWVISSVWPAAIRPTYVVRHIDGWELVGPSVYVGMWAVASTSKRCRKVCP